MDTNAKQRFSLIPATADETTAFQEPDTDSPIGWLIRANQGHSVEMSAEDMSDLLTPLTLEDPSSLPEVVVHGTRKNLWPTILRSGGLKPMERTHIHLATGVPAKLREAFGLNSTAKQEEQPQTTTPTVGTKDEDDTVGGVAEVPTAGKSSANAEQAEVKSGMRNSSTLLIFIGIRKALEHGIEFFMSQNGVVLTAGKNGVLGVEFFEKVVEKGAAVLARDGKVP